MEVIKQVDDLKAHYERKITEISDWLDKNNGSHPEYASKFRDRQIYRNELKALEEKSK